MRVVRALPCCLPQHSGRFRASSRHLMREIVTQNGPGFSSDVAVNDGWKILLILLSSYVVIMERVTHSFYPAGPTMKGSKAVRSAIISGTPSGVRCRPDSLPDQRAVRAVHRLELAFFLSGMSPHECGCIATGKQFSADFPGHTQKTCPDRTRDLAPALGVWPATGPAPAAGGAAG